MLIGKYEKNSLSQLILRQHPHQLVPGLSDTLPEKRNIKQVRPQSRRVSPVVAVHDEDETLGVLEIMSPQRPDLVLAADVPHGEADVLVLDGLHVEALKTNIMYWSLDTYFPFSENLAENYNRAYRWLESS